MDWRRFNGNNGNYPCSKRMKSKEEQIETFEKIEGRFAIQAKITTLVTAITGFYMVYVFRCLVSLFRTSLLVVSCHVYCLGVIYGSFVHSRTICITQVV